MMMAGTIMANDVKHGYAEKWCFIKRRQNGI